jgi:tripartite ATP-independent transporter DctP family solute receptor
MHQKAIIASFALVLGAAIPAAAQDKIALRFSSAIPPGEILHRAQMRFKDDVEKALPGRVEVQLHPGSTLFRQGTEVPALQRGNLEMSTMTTFEVAQQIPELGYLNRAYLFRDYAHAAKTFAGAFGERYAKVVEDKMGIVILAPTYLGTRQLSLRTVRAVKAPDDLKGAKVRMPAGPEWLLLGQSLGVTPTPMAMPEVYLAMQTGTVDGQDNPLSIFFAAKFHEVSKQVVLTDHLVQIIFFAMAKPAWQKMKPDEQAKVKAAALAAAKWNDETRLADEKSVAERVAAAGVRVTRIDLAPFRANADKAYAASDLAKAWDKKGMDEVMAVK